MNDYTTSPALKAALTHDILTVEEEAKLALRVARGDRKAVNRLVECNTRFAFKMAKEFSRKASDVDDFYSAGVAGLYRAARRYRPSGKRHTRFTTYARWFITCEMREHLRALLTGNASLSQGGASLLSKIRKFESAYREEVGSEPTPSEIAAGIGAPLNKVLGLVAVGSGTSLDASLMGEDGGGSLHEVLVSDSPRSDDLAEKADRRALLNDAMNALSPVERDVLRLRFGFGTGDEKTLETVALKYRVTRERIRQIEAAALKALRAHVSRKTSKFAELAA